MQMLKRRLENWAALPILTPKFEHKRRVRTRPLLRESLKEISKFAPSSPEIAPLLPQIRRLLNTAREIEQSRRGDLTLAAARLNTYGAEVEQLNENPSVCSKIESGTPLV